MKLDHDFHFIANRIADLTERNQRLVEIGGVNEITAIGHSIGIEGPDFHRRNAFRQKTFSQGPSITMKCQLILIRTFLRIILITDITTRAALVIGITGAGIIGTDRRTRKATQQLMDRLIGQFAKDIPQRDINCGGRTNFNAR